ncbi:MAG TPA: endo-1,4-beta-xylanase [Terriglobales bacterium]|nr:endo-1,4-beta-xylanase [Terriglobales bacterium]
MRALNRKSSLLFCVTCIAGLPALLITGCARGISGTLPSTLTAGANVKVIQRFGMHMHDAIHHWPSVTFGYWRLWDAGVSWPYVETARGTYDFNLLDQYVALAQQHGVKIIYVLGNTPQWTSTDPGHVGTQGLPGATAPPGSMQDWQEYVTTIVTRYKGKIDAYEIWNEVDLDGYWTGSVSQMVQLAQIAYQTIKQIDPAAIVLSPSLVAGNGRDYMKKFFGAGGDKFSDAVAYHLYDTQMKPENTVSDVYEPTLAVARQFGKDIWDTEVGWGPFGTFPNQQEEAAFTARTMILQAAEGINVIVWFAWDDRGPWVHLDFVGPDYQTPTPAAIAFNQVQAWLLNSSITCSNSSDGTWQCPVTPPTGGQKYIVWNWLVNSTFTIPSTWQVKTVTDLAGNTQSISGNTLTLTTSPVLLSP